MTVCATTYFASYRCEEITNHYYRYHLFRKGCNKVFQSGTVLYSIHVTERISCTFCEIVSIKISVNLLSVSTVGKHIIASY